MFRRGATLSRRAGMTCAGRRGARLLPRCRAARLHAAVFLVRSPATGARREAMPAAVPAATDTVHVDVHEMAMGSSLT